MSKQEILRSIYYNVKSPACFSSAKRLYEEALKQDGTIKIRDVNDFLSEQFAYSLHKQRKQKFERNPVVANFYTEYSQVDLIDVTRYSRSNKNTCFILTLIDVFTRFAFVRLLRNKSGVEVARALEDIFKTYRPSFIQSDAGKEFLNKDVKDLLDSYLVNHFIAHNEKIKCSIVERYQRSLMTRVHKYMTANGTTTFFSVLQDIVDSINSSFHRTLKTSPTEAINTNPDIIFRRVYGYRNQRNMLKNDFKNKEEKKNLHTGDHVRIHAIKNRFAKGYSQNYTDEIYEINTSNSGKPKDSYKIKRYNQELIPGSFYKYELQKVKHPDIYRISIIGKRTRGKNREFRVKYINFPDCQPEWINAKQLSSLK